MYIGYAEKYARAYSNTYLYGVCIRMGIRICNASFVNFLILIMYLHVYFVHACSSDCLGHCRQVNLSGAYTRRDARAGRATRPECKA